MLKNIVAIVAAIGTAATKQITEFAYKTWLSDTLSACDAHNEPVAVDASAHAFLRRACQEGRLDVVAEDPMVSHVVRARVRGSMR